LGAVVFEILYPEAYIEANGVEAMLQACNKEYFAGRMKLLDTEGRGFTSLAMAMKASERFGGMYEFMGALKVLIRQLEYIQSEGVRECPYMESQQILLSEPLKLREFYGAVRMLARQYEYSLQDGYREAPQVERRPAARHSGMSYQPASRLSARVPRDTLEADDSYVVKVNESKGRKSVLWVLALILMGMGLLGALLYFFVLPGLSTKQKQANRPPPAKTAQPVVKQDAEVHVIQIAPKPEPEPDAGPKPDVSPLPDASTKPDASAPTPAQKTKALYDVRDEWCYEKDWRAKNEGFKKMWTFHLDCHYKHLRTVAFTQKKYDAAFRYAKYLHKKFCTDARRKKAEPQLVAACNRVFDRYKQILNKTYLDDRKAYEAHRKWIPFQNYWARRRKQRRRRR